MSQAEEAFPRGGKQAISALERKRLRSEAQAQARQDVLAPKSGKRRKLERQVQGCLETLTLGGNLMASLSISDLSIARRGSCFALASCGKVVCIALVEFAYSRDLNCYFLSSTLREGHIAC